jgi:hypothetical protein
MDKAVNEFCGWIITTIIAPISIDLLEGWFSGVFDNLDIYEDEYRQKYGRPSIEEEQALLKLEEEKKNTNLIWKYINLKNGFWLIVITQVIHLGYSIYIGKQFPVEPMSNFENSHIVWQTICLSIRDATIQLNRDILLLRACCQIVDVYTIKPFLKWGLTKFSKTTTNTSDNINNTTTKDNTENNNENSQDNDENNSFLSNILDVD